MVTRFPQSHGMCASPLPVAPASGTSEVSGAGATFFMDNKPKPKPHKIKHVKLDRSGWYFYRYRWYEDGRDRERNVKLCREGCTERELYAALAKIAPDTRDGTTLANVCDLYMHSKEFKALAKSTRRGYRNLLGRLKEWAGDRLPCQISKADCRRYCRHELGSAIGNRMRAVLKNVLEYACDLGLIEDNVALAIRSNKEPRNPVPVPTPEQLASDIDVAPEWLRPLLKFAALTGMRRLDICKLQRKNLEEDGIEYMAHKTGYVEFIPWTPALREVVDEALARHGDKPSFFVFLDEYRNELRRPGWVTYCVRKIVKCGPQWTLHGLRHFNATYGGQGAHLPRYKHRRVIRSLK